MAAVDLIGRLPEEVLLRQLFERESCTYTYLIADRTTKDAVLIDPVDLTVDRDLVQVESLGLNLNLALNTHVHADHITGTALLKTKCDTVKSVISEASGAVADMKFVDGQHIPLGENSSFGLLALSTPGHTAGCTCFVLCQNGEPIPGGAVFTGDTMLIRGCGRTDFQGGSAETLYNSVHTKLFTLDPMTAVYPGHDYMGRTVSSIREEKELNPRLTKELPEFLEIMANLNLAYPKKLDVAVPANMRCGVPDVEDAKASE